MNGIRNYRGADFELNYREQAAGIVITEMHGRALRAEVPEMIDGSPVTKIDKKAFLSKKTLREICLPESIREIGDWAFAYCSNLERITLPAAGVKLGKSMFWECGKLERISSSAWDDETACLLAAAVTDMDAGYMFEPQDVGSREWLAKWDARLMAVMDAEDMDGYQNQVLCGEEDYGSTDVETFLQKKRMYKVRLAMLRLLNPKGMETEIKAKLESYLRNHTKGCDSEETWLTLLQEYSGDRKKIQLFLDLGCADAGNLEGLLKDMGEGYPEMKAIFLRFQDMHIGYQDFFADMML